MIQTLHRLIPASASIIEDIGTMSADNVLKAIDLQGLKYKLVRLSNGDWELENSELDDHEIFKLLHIDNAGHQGELQICTEACSRYGYAPFCCHSSELEQFVNDYDHDMFFDGDVVIVCEQSKSVTVFHHAGGYAHVKL